MARSASRGSIGADGTRFGDSLRGPKREEPDRLPGELGLGSVIDGKYRLEGLLGEGGMGAVWWAHHLQLDLPVAIKLLRAGGDHALLSERLKVEARAAAQLAHPAIVRVYDIDESERGEPFIVMELLRGESLADLLERGRLSGESAVQIVLPIAEALALAHSRGIVHRDLKPPNVFLAEEAERLQPKLLDFGIVKLMDQDRTSGSLTETGISVGSPDYMSPEQARGSNDVDYRADIWALSVVLYEAVTCETPFRGDNYNALMRAIVENDPLPLGAHVDPDLANLIFWGIAKERDERPRSVQELGRELARWLIARGVTEDVCGASLEAKWIARQPQKSAPLLLVEPVEVPRPSPVRTDTLLSARNSLAGAAPEPQSPEPALAGASANAVSAPAERAGLRGWLWLALAFVLGAGLVWAAFGRGTAPSAVAPASAPAAATPAPAPAAERTHEPAAATSPIEIASSAPSPSASAAPDLPAAPASNDVNSVSLGSTRAPKVGPRPSASTKPPGAAPRPRVEHDETRELLQAY